MCTWNWIRISLQTELLDKQPTHESIGNNTEYVSNDSTNNNNGKNWNNCKRWKYRKRCTNTHHSTLEVQSKFHFMCSSACSPRYYCLSLSFQKRHSWATAKTESTFVCCCYCCCCYISCVILVYKVWLRTHFIVKFCFEYLVFVFRGVSHSRRQRPQRCWT